MFARPVLIAFGCLALGTTLAGCSEQQMASMLSIDLGPPGKGVVYYSDVLPLAQKHCGSCHVEGGIGPFSMLNYDDARAHAQIISEYVRNGIMPPWKPASGCRSIQGTRILSQDEKDVFVNWADGEAAAGDIALAPPSMPGASGLAWIDASMQMGAKYTPPPATTDQYQCFILDPKTSADQDIIGYNVHPGTTQEVHHVVLYPADLADAQALDAATPEPGWTCFGGPGTKNPQPVGGWVPGSSAVSFPPTTGIHLAAGKIIVMQVHYNMTYVNASADQTTAELQFSRSPVAKQAQLIPLLDDTFSIPPGATSYVVRTAFVSPVSGTIWGVLPHAHTHAQAIHAESDAGCMIDIPAWDFHWQQQYFYDEPLKIEGGQELRLSCTYNNPGSVPLTWGEKTSDEMCLDYMFVTL